MKKKAKKVTGSCSPKCWFAEREKCECICEGKNHQIGLATDRGSQKKIEEMNEKFKEYQKQRKLERKMKREGVSFKPEANMIMKWILRK